MVGGRLVAPAVSQMDSIEGMEKMKDWIASAKRGFTLIELLVVIVIIGILAGGIFMMTRSANTKSAEAKTIAQVHAIATLLNEYKAIYGDYPLVTDADAEGYSSLNFTFLVNSASCDVCGAEMVRYNQGDACANDGVAFGLCSHFIPRATTIRTSTSGTNMADYYESQYKEPSKGSVWEKELSTAYKDTYCGASGLLSTLSAQEARDLNLQQIYRSWRRLKNQGMVFETVFGCEECDVARYSAGAEADGWGRGLRYRNEGGAGEIVSAGADGQFGTADDIVSGGSAVDEDDDE
jgi:prepilin-type N-terminal cleavage/methylation domain-containing protein